MTTAGFLDFVESSSFTPPYTPQSGRLLMWSYNNVWYMTNSAGVTTALNGITSVTAADSSVVVNTTSGAVTIATNTIDVIAANHPAAANWSNNGFKITNIANGSASSDAAAFGQIPTALPPNGSAGGSLTGSYPNPSISGNAVSNAMLATVPADTVKGSIAGGTPSDLTQTQLTSLINPATSSLSGALTSAQYTKLTNLVTGINGWIDVTQQTNPVLPSNSSTVNVTNLNSILSAAPNGSTIYFPGGIYQFHTAITVPNASFTFVGQGNLYSGQFTVLEWDQNVSGSLITLGTGLYWGTQFINIAFSTTAAQTAGYVVECSGNNNIVFRSCSFSGSSSTATLYNGIDFSYYSTSNYGGELCIVDSCSFSNFSGIGIGCNSNIETIVITSTTINGTYGSNHATAGINCTSGGAVQLDNSDVIGCVNNLLINPSTGTVASFWCTNTYFDNSSGSCIKITGAGATVRTKFTGCSFTVSSAASPANAVEVSSTYAYGANGMGLDFVNCNVLNTFGSSGVGTGFNITGAADFTIVDNNVAGWATGVAVTPANANGMTKPLITNSRIGAAGGYAGNTVGVQFNAGSFTYGSNVFSGNDLTGNTTPLVDNSTYTNNQGRMFSNNAGLLTVPANQGPGTVLPATTVTRAGQAVSIPANTLRVGTTIRIIQYVTNTATAQTLTPTLHYGTTNTNADASLVGAALGAGTAAVGGGRIVAEFTVLSSTTALASITVYNNAASGGVATTGLTNLAVTTFTSTAAVTISETTANFLGLYLSDSVASIVTPQATLYEISSQ